MKKPVRTIEARRSMYMLKVTDPATTKPASKTAMKDPKSEKSELEKVERADSDRKRSASSVTIGHPRNITRTFRERVGDLARHLAHETGLTPPAAF